jgi:hypothetical protein
MAGRAAMFNEMSRADVAAGTNSAPLSRSAMYTILTTCPPYGSRNVGDALIERRTKELVRREKGPVEFRTIFREESLEPHLDRINAGRAVLMPAFPVRDTPMHPGTYRLVEDLSRIRVPMIPVGANWNVYPGDARSREETRYSEQTVEFLRYVADGVEHLSCREYRTCSVLARHGIDNVRMTGDPAWFMLSAMGRSMRRPERISRLVFSPPLSPFYAGQAERVMRMLRELFPSAELYCAFHLLDTSSTDDGSGKSENSAAMTSDVAAKNRAIRDSAEELGYEVKQMAGSVENLDVYGECDLHVGYECHAHLNFFSRRIPSVLIAEDARGVGFTDTLGVGGFTGFARAQTVPESRKKEITSGYCTSLQELELAPPSNRVRGEVKEFLIQELESRFRRYVGLGARLDDVYENRMRPFIRSLPG